MRNIENKKIKHAQLWERKREHIKLYPFSPEDYQNLGAIWSETADWADGTPLEVVQRIPESADPPNGTPSHAGFAPNYEPRRDLRHCQASDAGHVIATAICISRLRLPPTE